MTCCSLALFLAVFANKFADVTNYFKDVAIHYRCGDNVHSSGMGLLKFPAIASLVPADSHFVYVLSEDERRKTRTGEASFCSHVLTKLHEFLAQKFPEKTLVVLRGALIFDDMTRLALAPTVVATVSSFSLFPAIASNNQVYFPAVPPQARNAIFGGHQVSTTPCLRLYQLE